MREDLWSTVKDSKPETKDITAAWTRKDEKARSMIGLALDDGQLGHVMEAKCANEMWEILKGVHERGSLSNKIHVLRRLCSMRLDENGNMSDHLVAASELVHRLSRMKEPLKEHLVVAILLSSLPESYNPLVTALEGRPEEDLKLEYVKGKLLDEWRRKTENQMPENALEKVMKSTGCTKHMTNSTASLGWWNPCNEEVLLADGKRLKTRGSGQGRITGVGLAGEKVELKLKELLYVPGLSRNVLSVSRITDEGYGVQFGPLDCRIMDGDKVIAVGKRSGGLYYLSQ